MEADWRPSLEKRFARIMGMPLACSGVSWWMARMNYAATMPTLEDRSIRDRRSLAGNYVARRDRGGNLLHFHAYRLDLTSEKESAESAISCKSASSAIRTEEHRDKWIPRVSIVSRFNLRSPASLSAKFQDSFPIENSNGNMTSLYRDPILSNRYRTLILTNKTRGSYTCIFSSSFIVTT